MGEPIALVALAIDAAIGWPRGFYRRVGHPVGMFARVIEERERRWNRPGWTGRRRCALGLAVVVILIGISGGGGWLLEKAMGAMPDEIAWLMMAILSWPALAQRSLFDHVRPVRDALLAGDLTRARRDVGMIVGRDTQELDEAGVARAAIESLAESFCDGVAAPLFWLIVAGLPGIWAYKAINTADSMIGHREERWRAFGWAAARLDDLLNVIPARIGAAVICLAGAGGWRIMLRDARKHASPNSGWTEAAMAGALGLRLAGPVSYDGEMQDKPWIGDGLRQASARDIGRALTIYLRACLILWMIAGGIAWVR